MGLTRSCVGRGAAKTDSASSGERVIALAGNPNVGKSSVFNRLTGLKQHTGNWPGKTVGTAQGICLHRGREYLLADLPGTYSLLAHSREEEVARDFICFENPGAVIIVCDGSCLERNLNLVLQALEITSHAVVCVNLMDEAEKRGINIDLKRLSELLGVPVAGVSARKGQGLSKLMDYAEQALSAAPASLVPVRYTKPIEEALAVLIPAISGKIGGLNPRWAALRLLEGDTSLTERICALGGLDLNSGEAAEALAAAHEILAKNGISGGRVSDIIASCLIITAEGIAGEVTSAAGGYRPLDRRADRILTSRLTGIPVMLLLLVLVFWITVSGANIPSAALSALFGRLEGALLSLCVSAHIPEAVYSPLIFGVYHVLTWVIAVMLPPMAIFFPLFTLLEDLGYLPRIAFNLDKYFKKCSACGKQALTMCMGFGCNAAGIVGCRIIDSPRERLIAVLTNAFVPCNGRFPALISVITMFFTLSAAGLIRSALGALILTGVVLLGILATLAVSKLLSRTVLKGQPSSFTLELPPYRRPEFGSIIVRSILDRTLFVLGRAASVAAPAGLIIWIFANVHVGGATLLAHAAGLLDPFARAMGLDGMILLAFILGFPANEIVLPLIIMGYTAGGVLCEPGSLTAVHELLVQNGWTWVTAVNMLIFTLMHWPCSTTLLTVKKETGSVKWTLLAAALPTLCGIAACVAFTAVVRIFG